MALDFPSNPQLNQEYQAPNGTTYIFDGRAWRAVGHSGGNASWDMILGKPEAFPPTAHSHQVQEIMGLQDELNAKAEVAHTHDVADLRVTPGTHVGSYLRVKADGTLEFVSPTQDSSILWIGPEPPEDPALQPLWFDTTSLVLLVSFDDGDSRQWVSAIPGGGGSVPTDPGGQPSNAITLRDGGAITLRDGEYLQTR